MDTSKENAGSGSKKTRSKGEKAAIIFGATSYSLIALMTAAAVGSTSVETSVDEKEARAETASEEEAQISSTPEPTSTEIEMELVASDADVDTETVEPAATKVQATPVSEVAPEEKKVISTPVPDPTEAPSHSCSSDTYNCSDFSTGYEASKVYNYCIAQGAGDIHRLDHDKDGIPCESLQ